MAKKNKVLNVSDSSLKKNVATKNPSSSKTSSSLMVGDTFPYYNEKPSWVFSKCDFNHTTWGICQNKGGNEIQALLETLKSIETMTWAEIFQAPKGRGEGSKNHLVSTRDIIKNAQTRLNDLNLGCDELISFRVNGKERLWGYRQGSQCAIIWHDPNHLICPSKKKNT